MLANHAMRASSGLARRAAPTALRTLERGSSSTTSMTAVFAPQRSPLYSRFSLPSARSLHSDDGSAMTPSTFSDDVNDDIGRAALSTDAGGIYDKVAFIGTGKMAQALISPMIDTGLQPESGMAVYDVSSGAIKAIRKQFPDLQVADSIAELVADADLVVCAVKPQNIHQGFFDQFPKDLKESATLVSIMAGVTIQDLRPSGFRKIVRSMPNTPATIGQGMTVWCCTHSLTGKDRDKVKGVLSSFGKSIYVDDEKFVDMSTSISGSGPAYVFLLMEAMIDAGVHMGFSRETATTLCHHTLMGSTMYAMETKQHPAILRNSVTSPAGTTASAIYELENGKFRTVIKDAIWACYRRSLEMGGKDSGVGPGRMNYTPETTTEIIHHHYPSGEMRNQDDNQGDSDSDEEKYDKKSS